MPGGRYPRTDDHGGRPRQHVSGVVLYSKVCLGTQRPLLRCTDLFSMSSHTTLLLKKSIGVH